MKDKFFSILNILGLALGIAVSILMILILQNDLTYDQHYSDYDRIFRIGCRQQQTGLDIKWARSSMNLGYVIKTDLPEIESVVRLNEFGKQPVSSGDDPAQKSFYEERIFDCDTSYFDVFAHPFIYGNPKSCWKIENAAVITSRIAKKYFGKTEPIGKSLIIAGQEWIVSGVIQDLPENTHLKFDMLLSNRKMIVKESVESENFWNPFSYLYIKVPKNYTATDFNAQFTQLFNKYFQPFAPQVDGKYTPILEPLSKIHFYSKLDMDEPQGNIVYVYAFTATGIFIILLVCINYMNISTAKSANRSREIAVKKVMGSSRHSLMLSILSESTLLAMISFVLALGIVYTALNATSFPQLINRNLMLNVVRNTSVLQSALLATLCIGLLSGIYPAFYLSSMPVVQILKGTIRGGRSNQLFRTFLITTQFAISIFVVACTFFMKDQIEYVRNRPMGFNENNILVMAIQDSLMERSIPALKNQLLQHPDIVSTTSASGVIGVNLAGTMNFWAETRTGPKQTGFTSLFVGNDYLKTMGIELLAGRDFSVGRVNPNDVEYIVNESAVRLMGWGTDAIGKTMKFFHGEIPGHVIGVAKDFNYKSLHHAVEPLLIIREDGDRGFLQVRISNHLTETIEFIKNKWKLYDTAHPFDYYFLDQRFSDNYKADEAQYKLLSILSYVCIFISLLGVVGLSAFSASQRTKEIGIRKVLGASTRQVIIMLSRNVLLLVVLASIIVIPFCYLATSQWMQNFAYRTEINYYLFIWISSGALLVVFLTVMGQSLKTALCNPVESLKHE